MDYAVNMKFETDNNNTVNIKEEVDEFVLDIKTEIHEDMTMEVEENFPNIKKEPENFEFVTHIKQEHPNATDDFSEDCNNFQIDIKHENLDIKNEDDR